MINTTDFLDALRYFEYMLAQKRMQMDFKVIAKKQLLKELSKVRKAINNMDLGDDYVEVIKGTNEALKNL